MPDDGSSKVKPTKRKIITGKPKRDKKKTKAAKKARRKNRK